MRVMAFGPHPDDIEFLCAGTLAKYKAQGFQAQVSEDEKHNLKVELTRF